MPTVDLTGVTVEVSHRFSVDIDTVWAMLSNVERMAGVGPEHVEAHWVDTGPAVGAKFIGRNRRGDTEWEVPCYITECDPPHRITWTVLEPEQPSSIWSYELTHDADGTRVVQRFEHGPNYSFTRLWAEQEPDRAEEIVRERLETLRVDMQATLANAEHLLRQA